MRPPREPVRQSDQTYFITFQTARRLPLFRHERWALALVETIRGYTDKFQLHDFVIMPDHVHLLLTPHVPVERAVQLIKGGYSFRAKRAFRWNDDIWQPGFSDHRVRDSDDWDRHISYIAKNVQSLSVSDYPFCSSSGILPIAPFPPWLKPQ